MRIIKSKGVVLGLILVLAIISSSLIIAESDLYGNDRVLSLGIKPKMKILTPGANNTNNNNNNSGSNNNNNTNNSNNTGNIIQNNSNTNNNNNNQTNNDENDNSDDNLDDPSINDNQESSSNNGGSSGGGSSGGGSSGGSSSTSSGGTSGASGTSSGSKYDDYYNKTKVENSDVITLGKKVEEKKNESLEKINNDLEKITGESIVVEDKNDNPIAFFIIFALVLGSFLLFLLGYSKFHSSITTPIIIEKNNAIKKAPIKNKK
jgi:hypothetical protein